MKTAGKANNDEKERKVIGLNPGYIAVLIVTSLAVLCICGWKRELAGDLSGKALFGFVCVWAVTSVITLPLGDFASLRLSEGLYGTIAVYSFRVESSPRQKMMQVFTCGMLACWYALMAYTHRWSSFSFLQPTLDIEMGAAILAAILLRAPTQQFAAIWIGTASGDLWEQGLLGISHIRLGSAASQDVLWFSFLLARSFSLMVDWTAQGWGRFVSRNK